MKLIPLRKIICRQRVSTQLPTSSLLNACKVFSSTCGKQSFLHQDDNTCQFYGLARGQVHVGLMYLVEGIITTGHGNVTETAD